MSFCGRWCVVLSACLLLLAVPIASAQELSEAEALQRFERENAQARALAARVRVVLDNPGGLLRPGMYATLFFDVVIGRDVVSVPAEAVVMTGQRNLVFVIGAHGAFEPREITLGARAGDRFQVLAGLAGGERIVASANFLVDAESRLATDGGMAGMPGMDMGTEKKKP